MIKTLSHEQLTPLNSIINLSQFHLDCFNGDSSITAGDHAFQTEVILSSAKILEYGTQSQLSQLKIEKNTYAFKYEESSRADLVKQVENVAKPFRIPMKQRSITLDIVQDDSVPASIC